MADEEEKDEEKKPTPKKTKTQFSEHLKKEKFDDIFHYVKENMRDTAAYVIVVIGLVLLFFMPLWGEALIGIVTGFYFSDDIIRRVKDWDKVVEREGMVKCLVFAGAILGLFIMAPFFFVGAGVIAGLKYMILSDQDKS